MVSKKKEAHHKKPLGLLKIKEKEMELEISKEHTEQMKMEYKITELMLKRDIAIILSFCFVCVLLYFGATGGY